MRVAGVLHGMSAVSTVDFYRRVNEQVHHQSGGREYPDLLLASVNFAVVDRCVRSGAWPELQDYLVSKARALEAAGVDFLVIGSNTGHLAAEAIKTACHRPLLHVGDAIAERAGDLGARTVGLLGTRVVTERPFYAGRLQRHDLAVLTPPPVDRAFAHDIVFDELTRGIFTDTTRAGLVRVIKDLRAAGADAIVLGCTEYSLLLDQDDVPDVPLIDTTAVHVEAVVRAILDQHSADLP